MKGNLVDTSLAFLSYTDPNATDFDASYTQGPDTVIVTRSYFHDSNDGQNRETCPTSEPSLVTPSNPKLHGQSPSQNVETTTGLHDNDNSIQVTESNTDIETAHEPMQQSPSRQNDNPSTIEINNPTNDIIPQNEPSHSRVDKYNIRLTPTPNY